MSTPAVPKQNSTAARRLVLLARPYAGQLAIAAFCLVMSTVGFLALPFIIRLLTDSVFVHHDVSALNELALALVALVALTAVFSYFRGYLLAAVGGRIVADLRVRLYAHLLDLSLSFFDNWRSGDLISRLSTDTTLVQAAVADNLLGFARELLTVSAVTVIVFVLDWRLALVTVALGPLVAVAGVVVGRRTRTYSERAQEQLGQAGTVVEETLAAMRVVKAFGRERFEEERYRTDVEFSYRTGLTLARTQSAFGSVMITAAFCSIAGVLWFGGREVLAGRLSPGGLISFLFYLTMLIGPLQSLASLYAELQRAAGAAQRVFELLDMSPSIVDAPDARPIPHIVGAVRFDRVTFRYADDGPPVLADVDLTVEPGERIALVGPSGAGKSTFVSLIPRFYDVRSGALLIDKHDVRSVTLASLRASTAIVSQEVVLFGGSVRENIAYGRENATDGEITAAAEAANAGEFIRALPNGYDTVVGERGVKLSGGQRQRIAIARAVLKDAPILILDEATSSLDNESEALVQEALERLMRGRTSFVVAHRLGTVERADRIVVLDAGRIVEIGSHAELLARDGLYRQLYRRDFANQERVPA